MNAHDACEQAYINGYHKGKAEAEENAVKTFDIMREIINSLSEQLEELTEERDALMKVISGYCDYCKHYKKGVGDVACANCLYDSKWEWRGVQDV